MSFKIIAHRGESFDAPENTLASVNLAWERGADAVEIDVHLSADNKIVVIHDSTTKRIGNYNQKVSRQTFTELRQLDVGSWKNANYEGEKIPLLSEILSTLKENKTLIIEIKSDIKILPFLKKELEISNLKSEQIQIISFRYSVVTLAKKMLPGYEILYLADLDYNWFTKIISPSVEILIQKAKDANLDGLNVWAGNLLTSEFAMKVKASGLLLYVWTVNDPQHAKKLFSWNIDAITTDRAEWLRQQIK